MVAWAGREGGADAEPVLALLAGGGPIDDDALPAPETIAQLAGDVARTSPAWRRIDAARLLTADVHGQQLHGDAAGLF